MTLLSDYTAGTVSSSGLVITGTGTAWQTAQFREGDEFIAGGWRMLVQSVDSETQITLRANSGVQGSALSGASYRLRYMSDGSRASAQARQLIDMLSGTGTLEGLAGLTTAADKMPYFTGPGGAAALADLTPFARTLLDDTNAAAARATLSVRERLTANRVYYVRPDGNNANTGLTDSAGGAFATIQHAINVVASLDLSIYNVEIVVRAGTYSAGFTFDGQWVGSGQVQLTGDIANPANVLITATSAHLFQVTSRAKIYIRGFKMVTTTSGNHVRASSGYIVINGNMEYGQSGFYQIEATQGGFVEITADYTISGNAGISHMAVQGPSGMRSVSRTVTLVGTPNWASAYAEVTGGAYLEAHANTFVGAATGVRYRVSRNGSIRASGLADYFPGNAAGVATSGGQYGA